VAGDGRLIVVFQPYRVYRTRDLQAEIAAALAIADEAVVMEVFGPARCRAPGEGGIALTAAIDLPDEQKVFVASWEDVAGQVGDGPGRGTWWSPWARRPSPDGRRAAGRAHRARRARPPRSTWPGTRSTSRDERRGPR
jgi:hypothetical protein